MPSYKVHAVPNVHSPSEVKYHVMTEPALVSVHDDEASAQAAVNSLSEKPTPYKAKKHK